MTRISERSELFISLLEQSELNALILSIFLFSHGNLWGYLVVPVHEELDQNVSVHEDREHIGDQEQGVTAGLSQDGEGSGNIASEIHHRGQER